MNIRTLGIFGWLHVGLTLGALPAVAGPPLTQLPVEIHLTLCSPAQDVMDRFALQGAQAEERTIWFLDSKHLDLLNAGLNLRIRQKADSGKATLTAKLRPVDSARVGDEWFASPDFKCETDDYGATSAGACSLNSKVDGGALQDAFAGTAPTSLLSADQRELIGQMIAPAPSLTGVQVLGPIASQAWDLDLGRVADPASIEIWNAPGMVPVVELSTRTTYAEAATVRAGLVALLQSRGLVLCAEQSGKTRQTLAFLVTQLAALR